MTLCGSPHPTDTSTTCQRIDYHAGNHNAYAFSIVEPETWDWTPDDARHMAPVDLDNDDDAQSRTADLFATDGTTLELEQQCCGGAPESEEESDELPF